MSQRVRIRVLECSERCTDCSPQIQAAIGLTFLLDEKHPVHDGGPIQTSRCEGILLPPEHSAIGGYQVNKPDCIDSLLRNNKPELADFVRTHHTDIMIFPRYHCEVLSA